MFEHADIAARQPSFVTGSQGAAADTLILALGSPLRGDDGAGLAALERLRQLDDLPENITLFEGGEYDLMTILLTGDYKRVLIVDAADFGGAPGEWIFSTSKDIEFIADDVKLCKTLHNASLSEVLALCEVLGITLPEIVIYGIQPQDICWSPGLSEPVEEAVQEVCEHISRSFYKTTRGWRKDNLPWQRS